VDDTRFDTLTRALTLAQSRRGLLRLVGGLTVGGILAGRGVDTDAAAKRIGGAKCGKDGQCKSGVCLRNGTCSCSRRERACKQPGAPCQKAVCDVETGRCVIRNTTGRCGPNQSCQNGTCACDANTVACGGTCIPGDCCTNQECTAPETCGGGGTPHICGACEPATTCPANQTCGTRDDGCGGTLDCGSCPGAETCEFNEGGTKKECRCYLGSCTEAADCGGAVPRACQTGPTGRKCCCLPDGSPERCAVGPNPVCCSGVCEPVAGESFGRCAPAAAGGAGRDRRARSRRGRR
jgi:hypothetical protein